MAKEIKVIRCPSCGSVNKIEIKPDHYRCTSCQTEYFLDNKDVNINYNHNYNTPNPFTNNSDRTLKIIGMVAGGIFGIFLLAFLATAIFSNKKQNNSGASVYSSSTKEEVDHSFSSTRYSNFCFLRPSNQQAVIIMMEDRRYRADVDEEKTGTYLAFYDPVKKQLLAEEKISNKSLSSSDFKFRTFSDGNVYMVNNKSNFLKLDKENLKTIEVGKNFFNANKELQIGVATIEFVYENSGDGLVLLTNDGKKRYYYPLVQKLYTEDQYYTANQGFESLLPNATNKTIHLFTSQSSDYPEDKVQLLQVTYKDNGAGPKDIVDHVSWGKDYGGSGIFTERDPYKKVLISDYNKQSGRIINWKDLTPERLYFAPSIVLDDGKTLIIQFRADANTKSPFKLQQLNRQNGSIEWTSAIPEGQALESLSRYKNGFFGVNTADGMVLLDAKGNITSNYNLE